MFDRLFDERQNGPIRQLLPLRPPRARDYIINRQPQRGDAHFRPGRLGTGVNARVDCGFRSRFAAVQMRFLVFQQVLSYAATVVFE